MPELNNMELNPEDEAPIRLPPQPSMPPKEIKENKTKNKKKTSNRKSVARPKGGKMTLNQLKKYKSLLTAVSNAKSGDDLQAIMHHMRSSDFKIICTCMHDFLHDRGVMHNYFDEDEAKQLKDLIGPWSEKLHKFTNPKVGVTAKKKLLGHRQKGGSVILASIIGSLLPMAVNAIGKWIGGKK